MIAYIIIIVVVAVLVLGVGSTMFLRPRGMHGVRRSRNGQLDMNGSMPAVKVEGTRTPDEVREMLRAELLGQVETSASRALRTQRHEGRPAVILVVGVNGTGKTTTVGKLARSLVGDGQTVVLGAERVGRAAAADQLQTWGERVGAQTIRS